MLKLLLHSEHLYGLSRVWTLVCWYRLKKPLNVFSHTLHLYGLSPVWTLIMCMCKHEESLNAFWHKLHVYGFMPLCTLLCTTRLRDFENRLLQTVHSNGFSPEWDCTCTAKWLLVSKHLPHSVHLCLPVCTFMCEYKLLWCKKRFSHRVHEKYRFCPVCLFLWVTKFLLSVNRLWHTVQKCSLRLSSGGQSVISASGFRTKALPAHA